jgi:excisionase family DNA binding protein
MAETRKEQCKAEGERIYTTVDVANVCKVTQRAVIYWIDKGKLEAYRTPGGHRRVLERNLREFMDRHGIPMGSAEDPRRSRRVLIVDDDPLVVEMLEHFIAAKDPSYATESTSLGFQAGIRVCQWMPDLVFLDLLLPEIDGYEICRSLKGDPTTASIRVVVITGQSGAEARERALACGADEFLQKPLTQEAIHAILQRYAPV